jgi:hypothetical protein
LGVGVRVSVTVTGSGCASARPQRSWSRSGLLIERKAAVE